MKQTCKDYALRLMVLLVLILTCALLVLGVQFRKGRERGSHWSSQPPPR